MSWIAFTWTTGPLLAGRKTKTWRDWKEQYARQFHPGDLVTAYDRSPRNGGHPVAMIKLLTVEHIPISQLTDDDYEHEGLAYLAEHPEQCPLRIFGQRWDPRLVSRASFDERRHSGEVGYWITFEMVEVLI